MMTASPSNRIVGCGLALCLALVFAACSDPAATPAAEAQTQPIETQTLEPTPIRISADGLPPPFHTRSARKSPRIAPIPEQPVLRAPEGFRVQRYGNVPAARWLALTPEGDVLCCSSRRNTIFRLRDADGDGVAEERSVFLDADAGAQLPFGMDFYTDQAGQTWFYLGNTAAVWRYRYDVETQRLQPGREKITDLPGRGYRQHWTRNVRFGPQRQWLYVTVGSRSNVSPEPLPRAAVLRMRPDGSQRSVFAHGLRNPVGFDFHPVTGEPYTTVNERDGLGDDLVPDYLTRVQQGEFYGWPYAYFTPENLDPRRTDNGRSEKPELAAQTLMPDVLFQSHSAALGLAFSTGEMFPKRYRHGAFVAFRGSWNRTSGTGYKIVFVPFNPETHRPVGHYEDFVTGFLIEPQVPLTWGRPVGCLTLPDGSLLFTEEAHGRVYRVSYDG